MPGWLTQWLQNNPEFLKSAEEYNNYDPYSSGYYVPYEIASGKYKPSQGGRREQIWGGLFTTNPNVPNRFDDLNLFGFEDYQSGIKNLTNAQKSDVLARGGRTARQNMSDVAERLAAEGVTSGSYRDISMERAQDRANAGISDQLSGINTNELSAILQAMDTSNKTKLDTAGYATNVDLMNISNTLKRLGLLQSAINDWEGMDMQRESQPGTWDDIFSLINTGGNVLSGGGWDYLFG